jgi:hypothetical protein
VTQDQIREVKDAIRGVPDMTLVFVGKELLCALLEIAEQLAELNQRAHGAQELSRAFARAKGLIR